MASQSADEALARQLQAEEEHFARQQQSQQVTKANKSFQKILEQHLHQVLEYEDDVLQAQAVSVLPDHILALIGQKGEKEDELAKHLLAFFKNDFFTWVNTVKCEQCGSKDTHSTRKRAPPTVEDTDGRADMIEIHRCIACGHDNRFPRYNDPGRLLISKKGRCGEFANCFTLICRAAGLEARWVRCWEDHVFTEYYSNHQQRWIHLDPCENEYDKPLLYEEGWGKTWSYVIGFGRLGVADVSLRYSKDKEATKRRLSGVTDIGFASGCCSHLTNFLRKGLSPDEASVWQGRDAKERIELHGETSQPETPLPGRQTGSEAWRAARGELGGQTAQASSHSSRSKTTLPAAQTSGKTQAAPNASDVPFSAGIPATALPHLRSGGAFPRTAPKPGPGPEPGGGRGRGAVDRHSKPGEYLREALRQRKTYVPDIAEDLKRRTRLDPGDAQHQTPEKFSFDKRRLYDTASAKLPAKPKAPITIEDITENPDFAPADAATASQQQGSTASSGKHQQQQQSPQLDKVAFAKAVKAEFAKLMAAGGGVTPNQAAVQALENVKRQNGL